MITVSCAILCLLVDGLDNAPPGFQLSVLALLGFCAVGWNGVYLGEVARIAGVEGAASATAGAMTIAFAAAILGSATAAAVYAVTGQIEIVFRLGAGLLVAGAVAFLLSRGRLAKLGDRQVLP